MKKKSLPVQSFEYTLEQMFLPKTENFERLKLFCCPNIHDPNKIDPVPVGSDN